MKCTIQLGFALLNGTFHLSPHENICTITLININYLYTIDISQQNKQIIFYPKIEKKKQYSMFSLKNGVQYTV